MANPANSKEETRLVSKDVSVPQLAAAREIIAHEREENWLFSEFGYPIYIARKETGRDSFLRERVFRAMPRIMRGSTRLRSGVIPGDA